MAAPANNSKPARQKENQLNEKGRRTLYTARFSLLSASNFFSAYRTTVIRRTAVPTGVVRRHIYTPLAKPEALKSTL